MCVIAHTTSTSADTCHRIRHSRFLVGWLGCRLEWEGGDACVRGLCERSRVRFARYKTVTSKKTLKLPLKCPPTQINFHDLPRRSAHAHRAAASTFAQLPATRLYFSLSRAQFVTLVGARSRSVSLGHARRSSPCMHTHATRPTPAPPPTPECWNNEQLQ